MKRCGFTHTCSKQPRITFRISSWTCAFLRWTEAPEHENSSSYWLNDISVLAVASDWMATTSNFGDNEHWRGCSNPQCRCVTSERNVMTQKQNLSRNVENRKKLLRMQKKEKNNKNENNLKAILSGRGQNLYCYCYIRRLNREKGMSANLVSCPLN